jgi:hypothetical protein
MTRKHFETIAAAIKAQATTARNCYPPQERNATLDALGGVADTIADACRQDNPRFDRRRFMEACGF